MDFDWGGLDEPSFKKVAKWAFERYDKDHKNHHMADQKRRAKEAREVIFNGPDVSLGHLFSVRFTTERVDGSDEEKEEFRQFQMDVDEKWCMEELGPGVRGGNRRCEGYELLKEGGRGPIQPLEEEMKDAMEQLVVLDKFSVAFLQSFEVVGAGLSAVNGIYRRDGSANKGPKFKHETADHWIRLSSDRKRWVVVPADGNTCHTCIYKANSDPMMLPTGGWCKAGDYSKEFAELDGWDGFQMERMPAPHCRAAMFSPAQDEAFPAAGRPTLAEKHPYKATFEGIVSVVLPFYDSHPSIQGKRRAKEAKEVFANGLGMFSVRLETESIDGSDEESKDEFRQFTIEATECTEMSEDGYGLRGGIGAYKGEQLLKGGTSQKIPPLPKPAHKPAPPDFDCLNVLGRYDMGEAGYEDETLGCFNGKMTKQCDFLRMVDEEILRKHNYRVHRVGGGQDFVEIRALERLKTEYFDVVHISEDLWLSVLHNHAGSLYDQIVAGTSGQGSRKPLAVDQFQDWWPWLRHVMDFSKNRYIRISFDGGDGPNKAYLKLLDRIRDRGLGYHEWKEQCQSYYDSVKSGFVSKYIASMTEAITLEEEFERWFSALSDSQHSSHSLYRPSGNAPFRAKFKQLEAAFRSAINQNDLEQFKRVVDQMPHAPSSYPVSHKVERLLTEAQITFFWPSPGDDQQGPLTLLGAKGSGEMVRAAREVFPAIITSEHPKTSWSMLHAAAKAGNVAGLQAMLELEAGNFWFVEHALNAPAGRYMEKETVLTVACAAGNADAVQLLLQAKATTGFAMQDGRTALHLAAASGSTEMVEMLLAAGADTAAKTSEGEAPADLAQSEDLKAMLA